jgi:hypothetical protein
MNGIAIEYIAVMKDFLEGNTSITVFQNAYLTKFKNDAREFDKRTFKVLDELFGDIDACTSDTDLIDEDPSFYINEDQLRQKVAIAIKRLE